MIILNFINSKILHFGKSPLALLCIMVVISIDEYKTYSRILYLTIVSGDEDWYIQNIMISFNQYNYDNCYISPKNFNF